MRRSFRAPPDSRDPSAPGRGRVLVVDELELSHLLLRRILEHEGYQVEVAETGETALERLTHEAPQAILLDLQVCIGATSLLDVLRTGGEMERTPVIVLAPAGTTSRVRQRAMELGARAVVEKPFSHDDIVGCLHRVTAGEDGGRAVPVSSRVVAPRAAGRSGHPTMDQGGRRAREWASEIGSIFSDILTHAEAASDPQARPTDRAASLAAIGGAARKGCLCAASMVAHAECELPAPTIPPPFRADLVTELRRQLATLRERLPGHVGLTFATEDPLAHVLVPQTDLEQVLGEFFDLLLTEVRCLPRRTTVELQLELARMALSTEPEADHGRMRLASALRSGAVIGRPIEHDRLHARLERQGGALRSERHEHLVKWTLELPAVGLE